MGVKVVYSLVSYIRKAEYLPLIYELYYTWLVPLTRWGRICVDILTIIASDNGLWPGRRQAIISTSAGILLNWPWGSKFSEFKINIFYQNWYIFIHENARETFVGEIAVILSRPQYVKSKSAVHTTDI